MKLFTALTEEEAIPVMREMGYEPLEPFPGTKEWWLCRCNGCGQEKRVRYTITQRGHRCRECAWQEQRDKEEGYFRRTVTDEQAMEIMTRAGLRPLTPYSGRANDHWPSVCIKCDKPCQPRMNNMRQRLKRGHGDLPACRACHASIRNYARAKAKIESEDRR